MNITLIRWSLWALCSGVLALSYPSVHAVMTLNSQLIQLKHTLTAPLTPPIALDQLHLYGTVTNTGILPLTNLPLSLQGTSYLCSDCQTNTALISQNGHTQLYHPHDKLPFGATVDKILPTQVNIQHNGQQERIVIPKAQIKETPYVHPAH